MTSFLAAATPAPAQVRVMPLGDSLTDGYLVPGAYRVHLWSLLQDLGADVVFVGSQENGPKELGSRHHEGHNAWSMGQLAQRVNCWLDEFQPDVVLLHIGTNDCWFSDDAPALRDELGALIDQITDRLPNAWLVVAAIAPVGPLEDPEFPGRVRRFAELIPGLVKAKAAEGRPVLLADMFNAGVELSADDVHPTRAGFDTMAEVWFWALLGF